MARAITYPNATLYRTRTGFWMLYVDVYYPGKGGNYIPSNGATACFSSKAQARIGLAFHRIKRKKP